MGNKRQNVINQFRNNFSQAAWQQLMGLLRLITFMAFILVIGIFGSITFDKINPSDIAEAIRNSHPLLQRVGPLGRVVLVCFAAVFNPSTLRFMIAPFAASLFVILAGAFYVKDIYAIHRFRDALRYVIASLFTVDYPVLVVDKGSVQKKAKETNLIDAIGGPGYVHIEPGNAAIFHTIYGPTQVGVNTTYFAAPFESIARVLNLDEQQVDKDEIGAMTRDGIQVVIKDIHIRYRIRPLEENGKPVQRGLDNPYPFSNQAMQRLAFNVTVAKDGPETWEATISRIVVGAITDFVASNTIDYLTAPGSSPANPRLELRNELLFRSIRPALSENGAELLWIDTGHLHIVEEEVDRQRKELWASPWIRESSAVRAYSDATYLAYQELGRAEAQAEIVMSIMDVLKDVSLSTTSPLEVKKLLILRTSQLLEAWNRPKLIEPGPGESKAGEKA